ncbi:hypothetical protein SAMN04488101_101219 [Pedobacter nyackensis]|uniref:Uncharacterized protein n=2 Tax=Pedobacter nyackensis TaxID=475255 RepID=A0A1W2A0G4_9SPHI|nr:hypothetical protein SAMN04488101_101219 [Pedobacter nyackensis]
MQIGYNLRSPLQESFAGESGLNRNIMGILRKGIFGGFEKKTGALIGRRVKGKSIIYARQRKNAKLRTVAQLDQQLRFDLANSILKWFSDLIAVGFKRIAGKGSAFNAAVRYNFSALVTGISPDYVIDYSKLVYSRGSLEGPHRPSISRLSDGLQVSWLPDVQTRFNQYSDKATFVIYCPDREMFMKFPEHVIRSAMGCFLPLPVGLTDVSLYAWMSFINADGKLVSDSVYLGVI